MSKSLVPSQALDFLGRVLMAAVFVNALPGKLSDFAGTTAISPNAVCPSPWLDFCWPVRSLC